jgi:tetratricopeptide (TPR) repeat protein
MRCLTVTGTTRETRGVMFYATRAIDSLPFADVDAWEDLALRVADTDAYPRPGLVMPTGEMVRPGGRQLAHLEAILRALAATTDDEFDAGQWTRHVETTDGSVTVRLSLPLLLEEMAGQQPGGEPLGEDAGQFARLRFEMERTLLRASQAARSAATPEDAARVIEQVMAAEGGGPARAEDSSATVEEQGRELAHAALASRGRRSIQLSRRALAVFPDCADAWTALGQRSIDPDRALQRFREAVAAGERAVGPIAFARDAGHFWEAVETRPYMRARMALAGCLEAAGAIEEAAEHYRGMLRLNPADNQAVRHRLLMLLLEQQQDGEARTLIEQFKDDESPDWKYAAALVAFRELPPPPSAYRPYSREHAVVCASWLVDVWEETPGACQWLAAGRRAKPRKR